jgi:subtilisin
MITNILVPVETQLTETIIHANALSDPQVPRPGIEVMAQRIVAALHQQRSLKLSAADGANEGPGVVNAEKLNGMPPPRGVPFLVPRLGLLAVDAESTEAVQGALAQVEGLRADSVIVEAAALCRGAVCRTNTGPANGAPTAASIPYDNEAAATAPRLHAKLENMDVSKLWREAALAMGLRSQETPWGVQKICAPQLWAQGITGRGIRVAIVDSGVCPHIDLPVPLAQCPFVPGNASTLDETNESHGTHVAGTVLARNNGFGVVGVAPEAELLVARVLDANNATHDCYVAAGIEWAVQQKADVINLSLYCERGPCSAALEIALSFAHAQGVIMCAASGNESYTTGCGDSACLHLASVNYPASSPLCIAVGAMMRSSEQRLDCSNGGPELDVVAPGFDILSSIRGNGYGPLAGTSQATPHVTGLVALLLSQKRKTPDEIREILCDSAQPIGNRDANEYGAGLVQAVAAAAQNT